MEPCTQHSAWNHPRAGAVRGLLRQAHPGGPRDPPRRILLPYAWTWQGCQVLCRTYEFCWGLRRTWKPGWRTNSLYLADWRTGGLAHSRLSPGGLWWTLLDWCYRSVSHSAVSILANPTRGSQHCQSVGLLLAIPREDLLLTQWLDLDFLAAFLAAFPADFYVVDFWRTSGSVRADSGSADSWRTGLVLAGSDGLSNLWRTSWRFPADWLPDSGGQADSGGLVDLAVLWRMAPRRLSPW
eukprot:gene15574-biopygen2001